ncbi:MAG: hypothetical protein IPJ33_00780 [Gammaproteobacteria bacterium]|nr:hypothetical protein [Gammaproteobacteria bacterium]
MVPPRHSIKKQLAQHAFANLDLNDGLNLLAILLISQNPATADLHSKDVPKHDLWMLAGAEICPPKQALPRFLPGPISALEMHARTVLGTTAYSDGEKRPMRTPRRHDQTASQALLTGTGNDDRVVMHERFLEAPHKAQWFDLIMCAQLLKQCAVIWRQKSSVKSFSPFRPILESSWINTRAYSKFHRREQCIA